VLARRFSYPSRLRYPFRLFSTICYALRLFSPIYPCKTK
jgi:hypothetical protein